MLRLISQVFSPRVPVSGSLPLPVKARPGTAMVRAMPPAMGRRTAVKARVTNRSCSPSGKTWRQSNFRHRRPLRSMYTLRLKAYTLAGSGLPSRVRVPVNFVTLGAITGSRRKEAKRPPTCTVTVGISAGKPSGWS